MTIIQGGQMGLFLFVPALSDIRLFAGCSEQKVTDARNNSRRLFFNMTHSYSISKIVKCSDPF